jgi:hypothetical protein
VEGWPRAAAVDPDQRAAVHADADLFRCLRLQADVEDLHACFIEQGQKVGTRAVVADGGEEHYRPARGSSQRGSKGGAARPLTRTNAFNHRHRRVRAEAVGAAFQVAVKKGVSDH